MAPQLLGGNRRAASASARGTGRAAYTKDVSRTWSRAYNQRVPDPEFERRVLVASMWPGFNYASGKERYDAFVLRGRPAFKSLIESVVLHDRMYVPTEDFLTLTALVGVLGQRAIIQLVEADVLRFIRLTGALAYVGGGGGVVHINFPYSGDEPSAIGADIGTAVNWALSAFPETIDPKLTELVLSATEEIDLLAISKAIAGESYEDFQRLPFAQHLDPRRLPGLTARNVRVLEGQELEQVSDPVGGILSIATANLELHLMAQTGCLDLTTSNPIGHALRAREVKTGISKEKFSTLREIATLPDLGELVLEHKEILSELLHLRTTKSATEFRRWFHDNCAEDPVQTAKAYVDLLGTVSRIESTPARVLRLVITNGLGFVPFIGSALSVLADIVDTFLVDKIAERTGPKFFINELKQLDRTIA